MTAVAPRTGAQHAASEPARQPDRVWVAMNAADLQWGVVLDPLTPVGRQVSALVEIANTKLGELGRATLEPSGARTDGGKGEQVRGRWALCWVDGTVLRPGRSLADQGVVDGTRLWLRFVDDTESRTPVIENVTTRLALELRKRWAPITPAVAARIGAGMLASCVLLALAVLARWRYGHEGAVAAVLAGVVAVGLLVAASMVLARSALTLRRAAPDGDEKPGARSDWATEVFVGDLLLLTGCVALAAAGALAVPGPLGAPHAALAAAVLTAGAALIVRYTGRHIALCTAVIVLGLAGLGTGAARMLLITSAVTLLTVVLLVAMVGVKLAPSIARIAGSIALPVMPRPGTPWIFENRPYLPNTVVVAAGDPPVMAGPESSRDIAVSRDRVHAYMTGMLAAFCALLVISSAALCDPVAERRWLMVVLAGVVAAALLLHGRSYTDRWQSSILAVTAVAITVAVALRYILGLGTTSALVVGCAVLVLIPVAGLIAAVVVPRSIYTPRFKQIIEWVEYVLLAAVWPLAFWVMDVFASIRYRS